MARIEHLLKSTTCNVRQVFNVATRSEKKLITAEKNYILAS